MGYRALQEKVSLSLKIVQYKPYKVKHTEEKQLKKKKRHSGLWDNIEQSIMCAFGVQGEEWQIEAKDLKSLKKMTKMSFKF